MGCLNNTKNNNNNKEQRKLYIDLLTEKQIKQPEEFCGNRIKTTRFTV